MGEPVAHSLRCRSTPLLHGLPDLRSQHNFRLAPSPSSFLYRNRPATAAQRSVRLRPRLPYRHYDSLAVDGRAVEEFNAALIDAKHRPKRASSHAAIVLQVLESLSAQLDSMPPSIGRFQKKRNLYACCLNYLLPKLSGRDQTGNLFACLFRRYDEAAASLTSLVGAERIRASNACDQEIMRLRQQVKELERSLSDARGKHEASLKSVQEASESKQRAEVELELYRKYVFVKTGKRSLDWGMVIPDGRLPTLEYMRSEHPTRVALIEAQLEAARRAKELEYVKPEDDDEQAMDVTLQLQRNAINDVCDDLDSIARRIAELWISPVKAGQNNDLPA